MSNWGYVAIAYTVVWSSLAIYALLLARRVAHAHKVAHQLRDQSRDAAHQSSVSHHSAATTNSGLATRD